MKALIPIDLDKEIEAECEKIKSIHAVMKERQIFIEKQFKSLSEKAVKDCKPHWNIIEAKLISMGKLSKENNDPQLSFNYEDNLIYEIDDEKSKSNLISAIEKLFKP